MTPAPVVDPAAVLALVGDRLALTAAPVWVLVWVVGMAVLSGAMAAGVAAVYRWYARESAPNGLATLVGLSGVALSLNTTAALGQVLGGADDPLALEAVVFNVSTLAAAAAAAPAGRRAGDWFATDVLSAVGGDLDAEVGQLVRAVGRVVTVELPADVDDVDGYDPVAESVKTQLAGKTFTFPRGLTVAALRERLVTRLKADYDVGHVDVDLAADGTVEYLALGRRQAGLGPTLAPGSAAVAVDADPAFGARAGDRVQLWTVASGEDDRPGEADGAGEAGSGTDEAAEATDETTGAPASDGGGPRRVTTAELRAAVGDAATVAVDADDAPALAGGRYRLVTLPSEGNPGRELAGLVRAADETMAAVTVREGSALSGATVGALDVTVVAVEPTAGRVEAVPPGDRPLAAGEVVYLLARPDAIRKVEAAAAAVAADSAATPAE